MEELEKFGKLRKSKMGKLKSSNFQNLEKERIGKWNIRSLYYVIFRFLDGVVFSLNHRVFGPKFMSIYMTKQVQYLRINKNKVDSIKTERLVTAYLLP